MADTTVKKVSGEASPTGEMGQTYLAAGTGLAMRLWDGVPPGEPKPAVARDYETVGYVIGGRATLHLEGQTVRLGPGDSWVVPRGASHTYEIHEALTAVEATHPPARAHARDEQPYQIAGDSDRAAGDGDRAAGDSDRVAGDGDRAAGDGSAS